MSVRVTNQDSFGRTTGALVSSAVGFSVLIYVRRAVDTGGYATIMHMDDGSANFQFQVQGNGDTVGLFSSTGSEFNTGVDLVNDVWFAVGLTCDSSQNCTVYAKRVDNRGWDGTGNQNGAIANTTYDRLEIGNTNAFSTEDFNGTFGGAKIWTTELSSDELLLEAQRITPVRYADLNSFYPMLPGTTERFRDHGPTGVTLALFGGSAVTEEEQPPVPWGSRVHIIQPVSAGTNLGRAIETDVARALTSARSDSLGRATETDVARILSSSKSDSLGRAIEADVARVLSSSKSDSLGRATEADVARALVSSKLEALGRATEINVARVLSSSKSDSLDRATETDVARALTSSKSQTIGRASEIDIARAFSVSGALSIGRAIEIDDARAFASSRTVTLGRATEISNARTLPSSKSQIAGRAAETDVARAFTSSRSIVLGRAAEIDNARTLIPSKAAVLGRAAEVDVARALPATTGLSFGRAVETDVARALVSSRTVAFGRAVETDVARALSIFDPNLPNEGFGSFSIVASSDITSVTGASDVITVVASPDVS